MTTKKEDGMKLHISRERLWQKIVNDPDVDVDAGLLPPMSAECEKSASVDQAPLPTNTP